MLNPPKEYGKGRNELTPDSTVPGGTLEAIPAPVTVPRPHGTNPEAKLAALTKLEAVTVGPGAVTVKLTVAVKLPTVAVTETAPGGVPAVGVVIPGPLEIVVAADTLRPAGPATVKVTWMPGTGFLLTSDTTNTRGWNA